MIIENKNTSGYEWWFDDGCEKSPSAVIFNYKFWFKNNSMMPVRLVRFFLVIQKKKITATGLNSDIFPLYFDGTLFVYISSCK